MKDKISITLNEKILKDIDSIIDGIYIRNRSQAIETLIDKALGENKVAVIIAGGKDEKIKIDGTYKPLLKIRNETIIESAIKKLRESGFKTIYIIAGRSILTEIIKTIGDGSEYGVKINLIDEKEPKGDANSLKLLRGKIKTTFLVVNSDIIFSKVNLKKLWDSHLRQKGIATLLICSSPYNMRNVGTVKMEENKIIEFNEKPIRAESNLFWFGIFVAEPEIINYDGLSLGANVFSQLAKKGFLYGHLVGEEYLHVHTKADLKKIENKLK
jgi:mannose-1-phosphate guanylyltransferase